MRDSFLSSLVSLREKDLLTVVFGHLLKAIRN